MFYMRIGTSLKKIKAYEYFAVYFFSVISLNILNGCQVNYVFKSIHMSNVQYNK